MGEEGGPNDPSTLSFHLLPQPTMKIASTSVCLLASSTNHHRVYPQTFALEYLPVLIMIQETGRTDMGRSEIGHVGFEKTSIGAATGCGAGSIIDF